MKPSYLFLAPGFEEIEALATVDILRRADIDVVTIAVTDSGQLLVEGSRGVTVKADKNIVDADFEDAEWLICPGGMPGATNLINSEAVSTALKNHHKKGGRIAAICASPAVVLEPLGIIAGRDVTCYPGMECIIKSATTHDTPVVVLDNLITGNGPASTMRFALAIVSATKGESVAQQVGGGMLYYPKSMNFYF